MVEEYADDPKQSHATRTNLALIRAGLYGWHSNPWDGIDLIVKYWNRAKRRDLIARRRLRAIQAILDESRIGTNGYNLRESIQKALDFKYDD